MITLYYSNGNDSFKLTEDIGLGIGSNLLESTVTVMINGQEGRLFVGQGHGGMKTVVSGRYLELDNVR